MKETITLTGFSQQKIEQAKQELQKIFANVSELRGKEYLLQSHHDTHSESPKCLSSTHDSSGTRGADNPGQARVFPVIPKEDRQLVKLWFEHILPKLPNILSPRLGATYTASLVRRGTDITVADPWVLIESPRIPKQEAQDIIRDLLKELCDKADHTTIKIRFSQGTVSKLSGGADGTNEDGVGANSANDKLHFNFVRPYSKPRMGAPLGLLCSKKPVATLGGFVLVGGKKHMLTSEHFIQKSQELKDDGCKIQDLDTVMSPARCDLLWLETSLKQKMRDVASEIDRLVSSMYGDQEISVEYLDDPAINAKLKERRDIEALLNQVSKPPADYAVGSVFKRSLEPIRSTIPRSIADTAHLDPKQSFLYHMDWSLCKLTDKAAETGENQHKYKSNEDASEEIYIEEKGHTKQPGEICYQTGSVGVGDKVYYVGRGSQHRKGQVYLPGLVSRDSSVTLDWPIRRRDGKPLPYHHVTGDSGAWVIRESDNALIGQIHSHGDGQVLFTPIDILFEAISKVCGTNITLPPCRSDAKPIATTTNARPVCAIPSSPPLLDYLKQENRPLGEPPKSSPPRITLLATSTAQSSREHAIQRGPAKLLSQASLDPIDRLDFAQSLVSLPESQESSQVFRAPNKSKIQGHIKQPLPKSCWYFPNGGPKGVQMVNPALDKDQMKTQSDFHTKLSAHLPTWPADGKSNIVKARLGPGFSWLFLPQDHSLPVLVSSLLESAAQRFGT